MQNKILDIDRQIPKNRNHSRRQHMKLPNKIGALFAVIVLVLSAAPSQAVLHEWTGAISDNWFDAGNWNPATVPTTNDNTHIGTATVPTGLARINTGGSAFTRNLNLGDNSGDS